MFKLDILQINCIILIGCVLFSTPFIPNRECRSHECRYLACLVHCILPGLRIVGLAHNRHSINIVKQIKIILVANNSYISDICKCHNFKNLYVTNYRVKNTWMFMRMSNKLGGHFLPERK